MKKILMMVTLLGCGYTSRSNELVGQAKKVIDKTPVVCGDYTEVDISLGVLRNGVGSMSKEDVILRVPNQSDVDVLKQSVRTGELVSVLYDDRRLVFCGPEKIVTGVSILK